MFNRVCKRFDPLLKKRAFLKHYSMSNTDYEELALAREDLRTLNDFYEEVKTEHTGAGADNVLRQSMRGLVSNDSTEEQKRDQSNAVDNEFILRREDAR